MAVIILLLLSAAALSLATADPTVIVDVHTDRCVEPLHQLTIGLSVSPSGIINSNGNFSLTTLRMFQALSPAYLRVSMDDIGEGIFNTFGCKNKTGGISFTETQWISLNELAAKSLSNLIISLDARTQYDTECLLPLFHLFEERGYNPSWQLQYDTTKQTSGVEAGRDITQLRKLLDSVEGERDSLIVSPDMSTCSSCHYTGLIRDCLLRAGNSVDVVALQLSSENELTDEQIIFERVSKLIDAVDAKLSYSRDTQLQSTIAPPKKQLWIVETAAEGYTGAFNDALVWALRLGHSANQGYNTVLHRTTQLLRPTPDYWVSLLYQRLIGRGVLTSSVSVDSVSVFSQCAERQQGVGAVVVWGVNFAPITTKLALRLRSRERLVYQYALTADELEFGSTLLNGEKLQLSFGGLSPTVLHLGPEMTVEVPANSVFFMVFPEANAKACLNNQLGYSGDRLDATLSTGKHMDSKSKIITSLEPNFDDEGSFIVVKGGLFDDGVKLEKNTFEQSIRVNPSLTMSKLAQHTKQDGEKDSHAEKSSGNMQNDSEEDWSKGVNDLLAMILKNKYTAYEQEPQRNKFSVIPRFKRSEKEADRQYDRSVENNNTPSNKRMNLLQKRRLTVKNSLPRVLSRRLNSQEQFNEHMNSTRQQDMAAEMYEQHKDNVSELSPIQEKINMKNINKESNDLHYRPGEFYKALRQKLKLREPNILLKDIEDPHDVIVSNTKDSSEFADKGSSLKVQMRPNTVQRQNGQVIETATENMRQYLKKTDHMLKASMDSCDNNGDNMECCEKHQSSLDSKPTRQLNPKIIDGISIYRQYNKAEDIRTKREIKSANAEKPQKTMSETSTISSELEESKINLLLEELTEEGEQLLKSVNQRYLKNPLQNSEEQQDNLNTDLPLAVTDNFLTNGDKDKPLGNIKQLNNIDLFVNGKLQDNSIKQEKTPFKDVKTTITPFKTEEIIQDTLQKITKQIDETQVLKGLPTVPKSSLVEKTEPMKEAIKKLTEETKFTTTKERPEHNLLDKIIPQTNTLVKTVLNSVQKGLSASKKDNSDDENVSDLMKNSKIIKALLPTTNIKIPSETNQLNNMGKNPVLIPKLHSIENPIAITGLKKLDIPQLGNIPEKPNTIIPLLRPVPTLNLNPIGTPPTLLNKNENHLTLIDDLSSRITELNGKLQLKNGITEKKATPLEEVLANKRKERLDTIRQRLEEARDKILSVKSPRIPPVLETPKVLKKRQVALNKGILGIKPVNEKGKESAKIERKGGKETKDSGPLEDLKIRIKGLTTKLRENKGVTEKKEVAKEPQIPKLVPLDDMANKRVERLDAIKVRMEKAREKISGSSITPQRKEAVKIIKKREVSLSQDIVNSISTTEKVKNIEYSKNNEDRIVKLDSTTLNKDIDAQESENYKETVSPMDEIIPSLVAPINKWIIPLSSYTENIVLNNKMFPVKLYGILSDDWMKNIRSSRSSSRRQDSQRKARAIRYSCVKDNFNDFEEEEQNEDSWKDLKKESKDANRKLLDSQLPTNAQARYKSKINPAFTSLPMKSKRSINDINRNEEEMKALLTNEIIKEGPVKDIPDQSQNILFKNNLQETVSKKVTNQTGIGKMLVLAKQYQKTNPTSVEVLNTRRMEKDYKEPIKYNIRGVTRVKTSEEDNRAEDVLDSANNTQQFSIKNIYNRPVELLINKNNKTSTSNNGNISQDEKLENTSTKLTSSIDQMAAQQSAPDNIVTTILGRVNGLFSAITDVVENSFVTVNEYI